MNTVRCAFYNGAMNENLKQTILMDLIAEDAYIPMQYFVDTYDYTDRSIRKLMAELRDDGYDIEYKRNHGYRLLNKDFYGEAAGYEGFDRMDRLLAELVILMSSESYVSLQELSDRLFISKTTAKVDMDELTEFLSLHDIPVSKNVRGHCVPQEMYLRIEQLNSILVKSGRSVEQIDRIMQEVFQEDGTYFEIFKIVLNHMKAKNLHVTDSYVIGFVNFVYFARKVNIVLPEVYTASEILDGTKEFINELGKTLSLSDTQKHSCAVYYQGIVLHYKNKEIADIVTVVYAEFERRVRKIYGVSFEQNRNAVEIILQYWIIDEKFHFERAVPYAEDVKKYYFDSYSIAMEIADIFETHGIHASRSDIASFAVYLNNLLVEIRFNDMERVNLVILDDEDIRTSFHLYNSIRNTADPRFYEISSMNQFEFNDRIGTLDKVNTLVIDTQKYSTQLCREYDITCIHVHPMLFPLDIENIQAGIMNVRKRVHDRNMQNRIRNVRPLVLFESLDELPEIENVRQKTEIMNGITVIQKKNVENALEIYVAREKSQVCIVYGLDEAPKGSDVYAVVASLVKEMTPEDFLMSRFANDVMNFLLAKEFI